MGNIWIAAWKRLDEIEVYGGTLTTGTPLDELGLIQIHVLDALYTQDGQHASALAKHCGRAATSFTPILDRLEKRELIKRMNDPNDRRAIVICLTVKGYALRSCVYDTLDAINQKFTVKA